jgi:hypothetical protein
MTRHPTDLFSLVCGLLLLMLGLALLTGGLGGLALEWVGPIVAIGLGVLIVVAARPARQPNEDGPGSTDAA